MDIDPRIIESLNTVHARGVRATLDTDPEVLAHADQVTGTIITLAHSKARWEVATAEPAEPLDDEPAFVIVLTDEGTIAIETRYVTGVWVASA